MAEQHYTQIILRQPKSYYTEQEAAEYCRLEVQVIRQLHSAGVIEGVSIVGEECHYNDTDIALLRRARRLHQDLGVNLEGIEIILRLQARLEALQQELEQYKKS